MSDPSSCGRVVEYVSSLADIRSQRAVRERLVVLERAEQQQQERQRDARQRQEKAALVELRREKRKIQRRQVGSGKKKKGKGGSHEKNGEENTCNPLKVPFQRPPYRKPTGIEAEVVRGIQRKQVNLDHSIHDIADTSVKGSIPINGHAWRW